MAFRVEQINNQPIIVLYLIHPHTPDEVPATHEAVAQLAAEINEPFIYRIVDMTQLKWKFEEFQQVFETLIQSGEGGPRDERFKSYYAVGDKFLPRLLARDLNKAEFGSLGITAVESVSDAIIEIRQIVNPV